MVYSIDNQKSFEVYYSCMKYHQIPSFHFSGCEGDIWEACGSDWQPCCPTSPCEYLELVFLFSNLSLYKVGNKSDLHAERAVSEATGKKLAADMKVTFPVIYEIFLIVGETYKNLTLILFCRLYFWRPLQRTTSAPWISSWSQSSRSRRLTVTVSKRRRTVWFPDLRHFAPSLLNFFNLNCVFQHNTYCRTNRI